jgi:hypothetical protein
LSEWIKTHAKFIVAAVTPVFVAIQAAVTDSEITSAEVGTIVAAVIVAIGVLSVPNKPETPEA